MTDPSVNLGEIVVVGQKRRSDGSFPPAAGGAGGGGGGGEGGIEQDELDPNYQPPPVPPHPCDDPAEALEFNIDAAAAAGTKEFDRLGKAAGENGINDRERGAYMYRRSDGTIALGPIAQSERFDSNLPIAVYPDLGDIDPSTVVGYIHSHPAGQHTPSGPSPRGELGPGDIGFFRNTLVPMMAGSSVRPRMYVAAQNQVGSDQRQYNQTNYYDANTIQNAVDTTTPGPGSEINPEAAPCP